MQKSDLVTKVDKNFMPRMIQGIVYVWEGIISVYSLHYKTYADWRKEPVVGMTSGDSHSDLPIH